MLGISFHVTSFYFIFIDSVHNRALKTFLPLIVSEGQSRHFCPKVDTISINLCPIACDLGTNRRSDVRLFHFDKDTILNLEEKFNYPTEES